MSIKLVFVFLAFLVCFCKCRRTDDEWIGQLAGRIEQLEKKTNALIQKNEELEKKVAAQQIQIEDQVSRLEKCVKTDDKPVESSDHSLNGDVAYMSVSVDKGVIGHHSDLKNNDDKRRFVLSNEGPIAFTARIDTVFIDHVATNQTIKFDTIVTNIGGAYNEKSGIFVAPISGIYVFSCSLLDHVARADHSGTMLHAEIVQNHKVLGRIFAHAESTSYRDQGAQTVFTQVNMGEQVWVQAIDNMDLTLGGDLYSTFSGYLLYPME